LIAQVVVVSKTNRLGSQLFSAMRLAARTAPTTAKPAGWLGTAEVVSEWLRLARTGREKSIASAFAIPENRAKNSHQS
jgi:hypothetical protein